MSKTLDERVVSMRFDNSDFEKNANTSLGTLEKLKRSLNFSGASKGLENVSNAAGRCNLSPLSRAVETVSTKFSSLEIMAVTALANITNSAVNAGKRIVSALMNTRLRLMLFRQSCLIPLAKEQRWPMLLRFLTI